MMVQVMLQIYTKTQRKSNFYLIRTDFLYQRGSEFIVLLDEFYNQSFFNFATRAVIISLTIYNPNIDEWMLIKYVYIIYVCMNFR